jgi:hypothetical protein
MARWQSSECCHPGVHGGSRPLVERLETMAQELICQVDGLALESLQWQAGTADGPNRPAGA